MGDSSAHQLTPQKLDSWKEIAAFFDRDERTVRRWEKERALPVHRVPGGGRGGVYAYPSELKDWLKGRASDLDSTASEPAPASLENPASDPTPSAVRPSENWTIPATNSASTTPYSPELARVLEIRPAGDPPAKTSTPRNLAWLVPLLAVAGLILVLSFSHRETRYKHALAAPHTPNAEAQELYLKGEYHWTKRTPEDLNKAVDYFTQAIVKDSSYAQAYVGLADCYNLLREFSVMPAEEAYPRALSAAQKAVELDDTSAGAHNSLAFATFYWNWDPVTAEREYRRALELNPNFVQGHHWYATFLLATQRYPEALEQIEQARKLDPSSTTIQADKGLILNNAGRENEAFALLKQLENTDPSLATTHTYLSAVYLERHDYENFFAESRLSAQLRHDDVGLDVVKAAEQGFHSGGVRAMRERMLPLQKDAFDRGIGSAYDVSATYSVLGNKQEALHYLQTAFEKRETGLLYLNRNPDFNSLHGDSKYHEITTQIDRKMSEKSRS
jgi:tetratricopeptide (TPR) repeat protein